MKGIVFTEFLEMVDSCMSPEMTEKLIDQCNLPSGGAYTTVGTYDHAEIIALVGALSRETGMPVSDLVRAFGAHLFSRFVALYPKFFEVEDLFAFLESIDSRVHVDVRKLYPDAELPRVECSRAHDNHLAVHYRSGRAMGDLAEGLISSAIEHFGEDVALERQDLSGGAEQYVRFDLVRRSGS
ncbi:MAG: heme NO-binding domain-containing protein [Rhodobiaceae bacterium]|nr:heme NO-binding domain-containing protein [Rhodobiaceae bacterium]MCC0014737.1 heme NO-binding domain-containing protein [Rhodobiaceae bacterium]MCC0041406.1 heme NO-binding domain-containing protein [Rhodobiaceae bacterium]MCC0053759.1 heme NO-binding domain-containing protein [Rhodobiaceae bacterium]